MFGGCCCCCGWPASSSSSTGWRLGWVAFLSSIQAQIGSSSLQMRSNRADLACLIQPIFASSPAYTQSRDSTGYVLVMGDSAKKKTIRFESVPQRVDSIQFDSIHCSVRISLDSPHQGFWTEWVANTSRPKWQIPPPVLTNESITSTFDLRIPNWDKSR